MDNRYFFELVEKHAKGECSEQEIELLITYYDVLSSQHKALLSDKQIRQIEQLIWSRIVSNMDTKGQRRKAASKIGYRLLLYPVAAAIAVVLSVGFFFFFRGESDRIVLSKPDEILTPGSNKATLITASGNVIALDGEKGGITDQGGLDIRYSDGSAVPLSNTSLRETVGLSDSSSAFDGLHTVMTPRGGQYVVVLPDASKVWLNAHSSLKYPARFDGDKREVFLEGEAYFEVARQQNTFGTALPFKVITKNQVIEVLGTEFNVAAYPEGSHEKTTLVSGGVKVSTHYNGEEASGVLKPGEQCLVSSGGMDIHQVDIYSAIAWKNGRFSFDDKPFTEIMAELGRWYNFTVDYEGPVPSAQFVGGAFRTDSISSVLHFLESAHLAYQIKTGSDGTYQLTIKTRKEER